MDRGVLLLFLFFGIFYSGAQESYLKFRQITIDDGLSQNSVNCMIQDKRGFVWLGTQDGLNRFDGTNYLHYRNERNNPNSLSSNYIWTIYEDEAGIFWIGTFGGGLNRLNPETGKITHFRKDESDPDSFPSDRVFSIVEYPEGTLWLGCNEGLVKFDKSTGSSELFLAEHTPDGSLKNNFIGTIARDAQDKLWLRSDDGLTHFDPETNAVTSYQHTPFTATTAMGAVYQIRSFGDSFLVVCDAGIIQVDPSEKTDNLLLSSTDPAFGGDSVTFTKVAHLGDRKFAIGSSDGLILFDGKKDKIDRFMHNTDDPFSLTHNNVTAVFRSHDDVLWVGTRNGLNLLEKLNPDFVHIRHMQGKEGLSSKHVNSFLEEEEGVLWIGTTDGLNLYDRHRNSFRVFRSGKPGAESLRSDYILCLFKDSKGNRWVGTRRDGFYMIEPGSSGFKLRRIQPLNDKNYSVSVHFITESSDGTIWLGTGGQSLWKYLPDKNEVIKYPYNSDGSGPAHNYVFTILEDSEKNLWLGTPTGGLNLFNPETEQFKYFQHNARNEGSLSNNLVLSLFEDAEKHLWIGTNGGLNKLIPAVAPEMFQTLDPSEALFEWYGMEEGLPNEVIYGMLQDGRNDLWISTNRGLAVFDTSEGKVIETYDVSHGLQSNEFNQNGFYKDVNGRFYFGGVNGFNSFHPDSIIGNIFPPKTILTAFSLYNQEVGVHESIDGFELDSEIFAKKSISLKWKHDVVTIDYAGLSYQSPEKNSYRYRLLGFKDDWVEVGNNSSVTYTNLDPGDYTFEVQSANNSGIWDPEPARLLINVGAPPWASWYAYMIYILAIGSIFYFILKFRTRKVAQKIKMTAEIEKARNEEREEFRKRSSRDFHDEAGTKITRMALVTELLKKEVDKNQDASDYLEQIEENLQQLNTGMRDFIWALDPEKDNIHETLLRFNEFAAPLCEYAGIEFHSHPIPNGLEERVMNMAQRRHLLLILKEGLNNSIKHASPSMIDFSTTFSGNTLELFLKDDGCGFNKSELNGRGNGIRNMKERAETADFQIETHSEEGEGTTIWLRLETTRKGNE